MSFIQNEVVPSIDYNKLLQELPLIHELFPYSTTTLVIDTNIVFSELYFMIRRNITSTTLLTLAQSKRIVLYFPKEKIYEIEDKLLKLAKETSTSEEVIRELWEQTYAGIIRFVPDLKPKESSVLESELRDPDDIPFLRLATFLAPEWFFSQDKDLADLGVAESSYVKVSIDLREFHAGQSMMYSLIVGGQMFTIIGIGAIYAFCRTIRGLWTFLKQSPSWMKILLVAIILLAFTSSRLRKNLRNLIDRLPQMFQEAKPVLIDMLESGLEYWSEADAIKKSGSKRLSQRRPEAHQLMKPKTAEQYIIHVLAHSPEPLSVSTISKLVQNQGYATSNQRFNAYIARILKSSPIFSETYDGKWILGSMLEVATTGNSEA
ncbi:PIN domain-containing protein [Alicyclobacillus fastidiosus]|uniref:PIN domain-containing protein n=1 Tax=Alicyclobacillus fastidiosus TaxID=392011 RepID=A0ABV5AJ75_9BACL|nr:PIN domain-containing protein [Alicyclobacillus fastidiosus]WEH09122.1 PIN domain-containing protein [Alicyclobacillus fastidiosus]